MEKRVLLINPPYPVTRFPSPHLGLLALGSFLMERGYRVRIEDYVVNPYSRERAAGVIESFRPHYAGVTAATMNVNRAMEIARDYSELCPSLTVLAGGPHVSFDAENILRNNPHIDYIVRGEGELTALELLAALDQGGTLDGIAGVSWRRGGSIVHNPPRPFIEDLGILPLPSPSLMEVSKYRALGLPLNMTTSRGCPFRCVFCAGGEMFGHRVRYYDADRVVEHFGELQRFRPVQINIADDFFTSNRERCTRICSEIIRRGLVYPWTAFARVDTVSAGLLAVMREAGCTTLCFGIESGDQGILDRIRKKTTREMCQRAVELCREAGIEPMTSFILGLPGETEETAAETMSFSRTLSKTRGYHLLAPFPGTELRSRTAEYGIRILTDDWDLYDTGHAVAESYSFAGERAAGLAREFYDLIDSYVAGVMEKARRGASLDAEESAIALKKKSFLFAEKLISGDLLQRYRGDPARDSMEDFVEYCVRETGFDRHDVTKEVKRLVDSGCISFSPYPGDLKVSWL